jgi:ribonucleoside-diphosphate reductase beta chain
MAATLLELTSQGDVATISDESKLGRVKLLTPQQLYELWERQQWLSQELDFSQDKHDWTSLTEEERDWFVWGMSAFFVGEERVTTQFSGLVMAYEDEQEESFLTTQQVDEARHMQFFDRFYREVVGMGDAGIQDRLAKVRENVNDDFVELFDNALVDAGRRLIADPSNVDAKVDFVTAYHMVIEGTLALTGQWTITDYWEKTGKMQGFLEGFKNVARDEHRHVAYGTWYLKKACAESPELADRVRATLHELLPIASGVLVPPGQDPNDWELLGYTSEQVNKFAFTALTRRLKVIGVPLVAPEPAAA